MNGVVILLLLLGSGLMLIAAIGLLRLPDLLCRSHAVAKALTLGIFLLLLGLWVSLGSERAALKVIAAMLFQMVTIPVASHLVSQQALRKGIPRWHSRPMDDHRQIRADPETRAR
jgi:multicomponent Na+:H+ antiporter subunit G